MGTCSSFLSKADRKPNCPLTYSIWCPHYEWGELYLCSPCMTYNINTDFTFMAFTNVGDWSPQVRNFGTRWRTVVNFMLYIGVKKGPDTHSTWQPLWSPKRESFLLLPAIMAWNFCCPNKTLVTKLTKLQLFIICQKLNHRHQDWRSLSQSTTISAPLNDPLKTKKLNRLDILIALKMKK